MRRLFLLLLAFYPAALAAQAPMPWSRTWTDAAGRLAISVWAADSASAFRALEAGHIAAADGVGAAALDSVAAAIARVGQFSGSAERDGVQLYFGAPAAGEAWGVAVLNPAREGDLIALLTLQAGAVAVRDRPALVAAIAPSAGAADEVAVRLAGIAEPERCATAARLGWQAIWVTEGGAIAGSASLDGFVQPAGMDARRWKPCPT